MGFRVPIASLMFREPVTAGMNPYTLMALVPLLRNTNEDHEPIEVFLLQPGIYRIEDGRHRVIASMMAGRKDILAKEKDGN